MDTFFFTGPPTVFDKGLDDTISLSVYDLFCGMLYSCFLFKDKKIKKMKFMIL